jgi:hypothetical protein
MPIIPSTGETQHLSTSFIRQLRHAPALTSICIPSTGKAFPADYTPPSVETAHYVDPYSWETGNHQGAIIRRFKTDIVPGQNEPADEFWHIRILAKVPASAESSDTEEGGQRIWRDFARFEGKTVPHNVLEAVYAESMYTVNDMRGLRRRGFGKDESGCDILKEWRETAGEDSDDETLSECSGDYDEHSDH